MQRATASPQLPLITISVRIQEIPELRASAGCEGRVDPGLTELRLWLWSSRTSADAVWRYREDVWRLAWQLCRAPEAGPSQAGMAGPSVGPAIPAGILRGSATALRPPGWDQVVMGDVSAGHSPRRGQPAGMVQDAPACRVDSCRGLPSVYGGDTCDRPAVGEAIRQEQVHRVPCPHDCAREHGPCRRTCIQFPPAGRASDR
jgi:hypothetical protein